jgi:hypothetical protein
MKRINIVLPLAEERESELLLFSLHGLLPVEQALSVNTDCLVVSLVSTNAASGNPILLQRSLTDLQMRILLPLLESPRYCPHEFLYASLCYSHQRLLAGLFSPQRAAREEWLAAVQEARLLLECAQARGTWRKELKQLYNVLSELRPKLHPFGLGITICTSGSAYALVALPTSEQQAQVPARIADRGLCCKIPVKRKEPYSRPSVELRQPLQTGMPGHLRPPVMNGGME